VVVALGPWSDDVFRPLGYQIPLAVKRGHHMHYGVKGNATLGHSVRDADGGFTLAPMRKGVRLTTGVEFADRDAPPSPVQLARDEPLARELFPLTGRLEPPAVRFKRGRERGDEVLVRSDAALSTTADDDEFGIERGGQQAPF
jgi:glycine/D-amino acid oxidase-like deaminating enzyme